jgi:hypothetical protein
MTKKPLIIILAAAVMTIAFAVQVRAVEGGTGFYLLGTKTTMSGYLPGPGFYGILMNYAYSGSTDIEIDTAGVTLSGGIDAKAYVAMPMALWVLDQDVLGGNLGFSLTTPFGGKSLDVGLIRTGPFGGVLSANTERDNWAFGAPVLGATLGWHDDNLHYTLGTLVNVPIGQWEFGNPVNMGFNRWAVDTSGAVTWLDPTTGLELSGAAGFTFNFENQDTNYQSGTEFHFESAMMGHLSHTLSVGLNGYAYKQVTGDSGSGATLGGFEGQVFAIGPALDYTAIIGQTPIIFNLRFFNEFGVENRLAGQAGFFNVAIPLGGHAPQ